MKKRAGVSCDGTSWSSRHRKLIVIPHGETWESRRVQDGIQCFCLEGLIAQSVPSHPGERARWKLDFMELEPVADPEILCFLSPGEHWQLTNRAHVYEPGSVSLLVSGGRVVERGVEEFTFSARREGRVLPCLEETRASNTRAREWGHQRAQQQRTEGKSSGEREVQQGRWVTDDPWGGGSPREPASNAALPAAATGPPGRSALAGRPSALTCRVQLMHRSPRGVGLEEETARAQNLLWWCVQDFLILVSALQLALCFAL